MNRINLLFICFLCCIPALMHAQIDSVIVETYYVSDENDLKETMDGKLPEGSITYRVYIKTSNGVKIKSIFGDQLHPLLISSSQPFFNNAKGKSFGKDISAFQLKRNTVALDTWLTLGLASANHIGVMKSDDPDSSILGGVKNLQNMLSSNDEKAGIPLTVKDGLVVKDNVSRNWIVKMDGKLYNSDEDTSIFCSNSVIPGSVFVGNNFVLSETNGYTAGLNNKTIVAQLTTSGDLRFELNLEIVTADGKTIRCVAKNPQEGEIEVPALIYPYLHVPVCGCPDPNFVEYNSKRECDAVDSCKTPYVLGCTDRRACNFNPDANMDDGLCCYPGKCANRDLSEICPGLADDVLKFDIYPNPASERLNLKVGNSNEKKIRYIIVDSFGNKWKDKNIGIVNGTMEEEINISELPVGLYLIKVYKAGENGSKKFSKN